jgi:uncharacterized membrane protein
MGGTTAAYATGAAVMGLPWILTTAVVISLPFLIGAAVADLVTAEKLVNIAYAMALLVAGPVQLVISRYAADRLYEGRMRAIGAPFCRGLAATLLVCSALTTVVLMRFGVPISAALGGAALSAVVGAQWTALSLSNGLCSPSLVLGAVAAASLHSLALAALLTVVFGLGLPGYLIGLMSGQALGLGILLVGIFRELPSEVDEGARLLPAFRDYAALAMAGLAFNASLWADKVAAWLLVGGAPARLHAVASMLAWFSSIPCMAWVFVEVETTFHRCFRRFYRKLEGGATLGELRDEALTLEKEAARLLSGAVSVQAGVTLFLELAAGPMLRVLGQPAGILLPYRFLLIAAGSQAVGLLGLILLYHFDLRREACLAAASFFFGVAGLSGMASASGAPTSVGTMLGCIFGAIVTWSLVFQRVGGALEDAMLSQPFGEESMRR